MVDADDRREREAEGLPVEETADNQESVTVLAAAVPSANRGPVPVVVVAVVDVDNPS